MAPPPTSTRRTTARAADDLAARSGNHWAREPELLGRPARPRSVRGDRPEGHGRVLPLHSWGSARQIDDLAHMQYVAKVTLPGSGSGRAASTLWAAAWAARNCFCSSPASIPFSPARWRSTLPTDLARRFRNFARLSNGRSLQELARREVGGVPESVPGAYVRRSPINFARAIAFSRVPLQMFWSTADEDRARPGAQLSRALPSNQGTEPCRACDRRCGDLVSLSRHGGQPSGGTAEVRSSAARRVETEHFRPRSSRVESAHGRTAAVSSPHRGTADSRAEPLALAREVDPRDPALHPARAPLADAARADDRRVLRDPLHRPLPARDLRLQRRRSSLDVAGGVLLLRRARHRSLSAVHARRRARLPGAAGGRVPGAALPRPRAGEVVAPRHTAVHRHGNLPGRRQLRGGPGRRLVLGHRLRNRADRHPRALRRCGAALHHAVSGRALRPRRRARPVGRAGGRIRAAHARRVPAVPARPGRDRGEGFAEPTFASRRRPSVAGEPAVPAEPPAGRGWTGGRIALVVVGTIAGLLALGLSSAAARSSPSTRHNETTTGSSCHRRRTSRHRRTRSCPRAPTSTPTEPSGRSTRSSARSGFAARATARCSLGSGRPRGHAVPRRRRARRCRRPRQRR